MSHCAGFNSDWMSKDQYKAWLISVPGDNTKAKCTLCAKTFSLPNMGELALKSYAAGKEHITVVTQMKKTDSVTDFFKVKCGATSGESNSASLGEPSTPLVCDTEDTKKKIQEVWQHMGILW